jgi:hypothetical protein
VTVRFTELNPRFSSWFRIFQNSANLAEPVQTGANLSLGVAQLQRKTLFQPPFGLQV